MLRDIFLFSSLIRAVVDERWIFLWTVAPQRVDRLGD